MGAESVPIGQKIYGGIGTICRPAIHDNGPLLEKSESDDGDWPFVSIVLPTWREEHYIEACLNSILTQSYPLARLEILVVDGMSTDATREIVTRIAARFHQVKLLDNPQRLQSAGMNRGILASTGSIIIRMDAHSEYGQDYVRRCVETLQKTGADNVGGPQRPRARTFFQRMVAYALNSKLGTGGAAFRHEGKDGYVDTVFPGAFRRGALQRVGLFDPGAITNEDAEINQRIIESGGKVYLSSSIECWYYPRDSIRGLAIQYFKYGRGRARTVLKHGNILRISSFLPFFFFFGTLGLLGLGGFLPAALYAGLGLGAIYAMAITLESLRIAVRHERYCALMLPAVFFTTHLAHACGVAWGLIYYSYDPDWKWQSPPTLT